MANEKVCYRVNIIVIVTNGGFVVALPRCLGVHDKMVVIIEF